MWSESFIPAEHQVNLGPFMAYMSRDLKNRDLIMIIGTIVWDNVRFLKCVFITSIMACMIVERPNLRHSAIGAAFRPRHRLMSSLPIEPCQFSAVLDVAINLEFVDYKG